MRKQHKWFGIALCFFLLMFAVSGIILNHRGFYSKVNVSRGVLPSNYKYKNWNSGLLRGSLPLDSVSTLIYGYSGLWKCSDSTISDFNDGLPSYAENRVIRNVVMMPDTSLFAVSPYGLFHRKVSGDRWENLPVATDSSRERFSDIAVHGDSLLLLSRDNLYLSLPPYSSFRKIPLSAPENHSGDVSLFRVFWLLHNGEMFGFPGRVIIDLVGVVLILLCVTGLFFWLCPKILKRKLFPRRKPELQRFIKANYKWHTKLGVWSFFVMLFVVITGWCLRPPVLIPLAKTDVPGIPYTAISPEHPWNDKLRAIRFDTDKGDWLLSTSDGFFSLDKSLKGRPVAIKGAPHVSVMGINVFLKEDDGCWLVGSLSGMWRWNRAEGRVTDYFTGEPMPEKAGSPFGKTPVSGYSADFDEPMIVEYYAGTDALPQPDELKNLPMSLWQLALEIHTGRIYNLFGLAPLMWIFITGLATVWMLYTGWMILRKK